MRTFIAVPLPPECRQMLEQIQAKLRSSGADVRWVSVSSIHLTLKFLGEIDPAAVGPLAGALRTASASHTCFTLRIHGVGAFPNVRSPKVVWCGVDGEIQRLQQLRAAVEQTCTELKFPPEERDFHPHLTLGRVQGKRNLQRLQDYIKIDFGLECPIHVERYEIFKSTLAPRGAIYEVLDSIALRMDADSTN